MNWNNMDNKDPWTGKPKRSTPPDLEQMLRRLRQQLGGRGSKLPVSPTGSAELPPKKIVGLVLVGILLLWFFAGIYIVSPAEQAVILRFGQYTRTEGPGPHWFPRLIESKYVINEQKISTYSYDAQMLTADANIVSVAVAVQYRIDNTRDYLFNAVEPEQSLHQATASALRQVIGHTRLDAVLTSGRELIRQQVKEQLTQILARYRTGLLITDIAIQPAKAPEEVKDAFDDAIKAQEDQQRFENQAQAYAMQVEPIAKGQAQRLLTDAGGYKQQVVLNAKGDIAQYLALLPQLQKAPAVTKERLYIDTMETVLGHASKILIDSRASNMIYLPIDKLMSTPDNKQPITAPQETTTVPLRARAAAATNTSGQDQDIYPQEGY